MHVGQFHLNKFTAPDTTELIEISLGEGYTAITLAHARVLANALIELAGEQE